MLKGDENRLIITWRRAWRRPWIWPPSWLNPATRAREAVRSARGGVKGASNRAKRLVSPHLGRVWRSLSLVRGGKRGGERRGGRRGDRDTPTPPEKRREGSGVARTRDKKKRSQAKSGAYLRFRLFSKGPAPHLLIWIFVPIASFSHPLHPAPRWRAGPDLLRAHPSSTHAPRVTRPRTTSRGYTRHYGLREGPGWKRGTRQGLGREFGNFGPRRVDILVRPGTITNMCLRDRWVGPGCQLHAAGYFWGGRGHVTAPRGASRLGGRVESEGVVLLTCAFYASNHGLVWRFAVVDLSGFKSLLLLHAVHTWMRLFFLRTSTFAAYCPDSVPLVISPFILPCVSLFFFLFFFYHLSSRFSNTVLLLQLVCLSLADTSITALYIP